MTPLGIPWGWCYDLIKGRSFISPVEWPVNASGNKKPVYDGRPVAGPDQVDIVGISSWVLLGHPADQLQDEADVVGLEFKYMASQIAACF